MTGIENNSIDGHELPQGKKEEGKTKPHKIRKQQIMGRSIKDYAMLMLKGMGMGAADVVPGVSGGTIAFIAGIYDELINSIKSINRESLTMLFTGKFKAFAKKNQCTVPVGSHLRHCHQRFLSCQTYHMASDRTADIDMGILLWTCTCFNLVRNEGHTRMEC